ncbi:MerR family transcriptional regulator [Gordoniibacillus kamchatkensis]|uniref:MerR family transcriptional regulator n=1 Tax=Gordoniibacillus kamchatkensis TaxID=1590651 RepID=A0ABR5AJL6_9BACL|nr:MerR family transcriptional regulator [Paenibacillus sp. VKM B-2647]KIL41233.1 MerR family transcriptional regulator [Paenibacillus sp. VKM B-2647]
MRIGELSRVTGVSLRSLRYYEVKGLLAADREENGYRIYNATAIERVNTIQFYLRLGFSTDEIEGFLNCVMKNKEAFCEEILPMYEQKLAEIDRQLHQLGQIRSNLVERMEAIRREQESKASGQ